MVPCPNKGWNIGTSQARFLISPSNNTTSSSDKSNRMLVVIVAALLSFLLFMMGLHIYMKFRRVSDEDDAVTDTDELNGPELPPLAVRRRYRPRVRHRFEERDTASEHLGLDKSVVELLPTFTIKGEAAFSEDMECVVCLEEFAEGERGRLLPKCGHRFHVDCIDMWFHSHSSCPLCRSEVALASDMFPDPLPADGDGLFLDSSTSMLPMSVALAPPVSSSLAADPSYIQGTESGYASNFDSEDTARDDLAEESSVSVAVETPSTLAIIPQRNDVANPRTGITVMHGESSGQSSPSSKSQKWNESPRRVIILDIQPELNRSTKSALPEEDNCFSSMGADHGGHSPRDAYWTIEITGEFQPPIRSGRRQ